MKFYLIVYFCFKKKRSFRDLSAAIEDSQSFTDSVDLQLDRDISRRKNMSLLDFAKIRYGKSV